MCQICTLLDKAFPSPSTFVKAAKELNLDKTHFNEVYNKAIEKLQTQEQKDKFTSDLITEDYLEHLRTT